MAKFCTNCGKEIGENAYICVNCGVKVGGNNAQANPNAKSKLLAGLLQLFLGSCGVGRFYLGYVGIGIAQIAVTWLTCGIGGLWPFIDGILILTGNVKTDAKGNELTD